MRRAVPLALVFTAAVWLGQSAQAQAPATPAKTAAPIIIDVSPLGRYIPQAQALAYFEFAGLETQKEAWTKTNAYTLLADTKLGGMLEELGAQVLTKFFSQNPSVKLTGAEGIAFYKHMMKYGFVCALGGKPGEKNPEFATIIIRAGGRKDARPLVGKVIGSVVPNGSTSKADKKGGRAVVVVTTPTKSVGNYWVEKDDLVIAFGQAQFDTATAIMNAIDKKVPTMADSEIRNEMFAPGKDGFLPIAAGTMIGTEELTKAAPPALGLDSLKQADYRWGFQDNALMSVTRISTTGVRKGMLALLDQPTFNSDDLPPIPGNLTGFTAFSVAPAQAYDTITGLATAMNPNGAAKIEEIEAMVKDKTRLKLREELLTQLGPKGAFYLAPATGNPLQNLISIPKAVLVLEVSDSKAFGRSLDQLMVAVNASIRESVENAKEQALAAANPDAKAKDTPKKSATKKSGPSDGTVPNFRLVTGGTKSYVLDIPAAMLPSPILSSIKPTIRLGEKHLVIATTPEVARQALEIKPTDQFKPADAMATVFSKIPKNLVFLSVNDPTNTLPATLVALPAAANLIVTQIESQLSGQPGANPLAALGLPGMGGPPAAGSQPGGPEGGAGAPRTFVPGAESDLGPGAGGRPGGRGGPGQQPGGANGQPAAGAPLATTFSVDPAKMPTVAEIAPKIFPATTAVSVDKSGITFTTRESFPDVISSAATSGVAAGLLLPAVQSARAAARRAAGLPPEVAPPPGVAPGQPGQPGGPGQPLVPGAVSPSGPESSGPGGAPKGIRSLKPGAPQ